MSRRDQKREPEPAAKPLASPPLSESIISGNMKFAGMVPTTNGYAVAVIEVTPDLKVVNMTVGNSQKLPQYVAPAAKQAQAALAQEVQTRRPGRLT